MIEPQSIDKKKILKDVEHVHRYNLKPDSNYWHGWRHHVNANLYDPYLFSFPTNLSVVNSKVKERRSYIKIYRGLITLLIHIGASSEQVADTIVEAYGREITYDDYAENAKWWYMIRNVNLRRSDEAMISDLLNLLHFLICFCRCFDLQFHQKTRHSLGVYTHDIFTHRYRLSNLIEKIDNLALKDDPSVDHETAYKDNAGCLGHILTEETMSKNMLSKKNDKTLTYRLGLENMAKSLLRSYQYNLKKDRQYVYQVVNSLMKNNAYVEIIDGSSKKNASSYLKKLLTKNPETIDFTDLVLFMEICSYLGAPNYVINMINGNHEPEVFSEDFSI